MGLSEISMVTWQLNYCDSKLYIIRISDYNTYLYSFAGMQMKARPPAAIRAYISSTPPDSSHAQRHWNQRHCQLFATITSSRNPDPSLPWAQRHTNHQGSPDNNQPTRPVKKRHAMCANLSSRLSAALVFVSAARVWRSQSAWKCSLSRAGKLTTAF